jgi:hypothetical protein
MAVDAHQPLHADVQARLLPHFPYTCFSDRLTGIHAAGRKAPLTVVSALRQQNPAISIKDRSGAAQADLALLAQSFAVQNLCHCVFLSA